MNYENEIIKKDLEEMSNENIDYSKLQNKSVLITGANGMLASYFTFLLMYLNDKYNYGIKILALGRNKETMQNKFGDRNDITYIIQDVCDEISIESNIDYIIHMASSANPKTIIQAPVDIIKANVYGTFNVLKLAKEKNAEVLFTSTREIYGKVTEDINFIKEEQMGALECLDSRACYPESKRMSETILLSYAIQYGVNFKIARIAHSYGPGININNDGRIMSDLISNVVYNQDILLKSKGDALRSFCYITDAITALYTILIKGKENESYNVSNEDEEISVRDLAYKMEELFKEKNIKVIFDIDEKNKAGYTNFKRVGLDTTKLRSLGWYPKIKLEEGILRTVKSFE